MSNEEFVEDPPHGVDYEMARLLDMEFAPVRLNFEKDTGWAVVGHPSGAIALDSDGSLLIRLSEDDAAMVAARLTRERRLSS